MANLKETTPEAPRMPEARRAALYGEAVRAMNAADTREACLEAEAAFRELGAYRDAETLAADCRERAETLRRDSVYATALRQMERKSVSGYQSAIGLFRSIPGWRDADQQASACELGIREIGKRAERMARTAQRRKTCLKWAAVIAAVLIPACIALRVYWGKTIAPARRYRTAMALVEEGQYERAWRILDGLDYKDSAERSENLRRILARQADVGSCVVFGSYEQDGNATNGREDILWRVIEKDGDRLLLLSEYGLDIQPYQRPGRNISWETCQLRAWLNGRFLESAFSPEEREQILVSRVTADRNPTFASDPGRDVEDRVFALSIEEAYRFFPGEAGRRCAATAYARQRGAYQNAENGGAWWWLRTPGIVTNYATYVLDDGSIWEDGFYVAYEYIAVRPAMWVRLTALDG